MIRIIVICLVFFSVATRAQSTELGFGCFGLVGGFAGYEVQYYSPDGLNKFVDAFNTQYHDSLLSPLAGFNALRGYRLGINFFRKDVAGILCTIKAYYSGFSEKNSTKIQHSDGTKSIFTAEVNMYAIGAGIDLGMPINDYINWKVIDASFYYYNFSFHDEINNVTGIIREDDYVSKEDLFSYALGSGFIISLIKDYISLEGSVSYTNIPVNSIKKQNSSNKPLMPTDATSYPNLIKGGGINLLIQLNLSIPT
ncbi:MAG: hypothetical protein LWX56_15125 [Ignavibacteria bacterium]|nr:hypothetical protein [Ignavibacteria bacterium]